MKVNIIGQGVIPGIKKIAPVYNLGIELETVKRLLNYKKIRVYDSASGRLITKNNVNQIYESTLPISIVETPISNVEPEIKDIPSTSETIEQNVEESVGDDYENNGTIVDEVEAGLFDAIDVDNEISNTDKVEDVSEEISLYSETPETDEPTETTIVEDFVEVLIEEEVESVIEIDSIKEETVDEESDEIPSDETETKPVRRPPYQNHKKRNKNR